MVWRIEFDPRAVKELAKLDKPIQRRIVQVLKDRIACLMIREVSANPYEEKNSDVSGNTVSVPIELFAIFETKKS